MEPSPVPRSRRKILAWGGLATLGLGLGAYFRRHPNPGAGETNGLGQAPIAASTPETAVTIDAEALPAPNHEVYSPLLNTDFTVEFPDSPAVKIRLVEVTPIRTITSPKADYQSFSLYFEAAVDTSEKDGQIARVSHPKLQPMDLFLAPVGRPKNGLILLEAAFTERV